MATKKLVKWEITYIDNTTGNYRTRTITNTTISEAKNYNRLGPVMRVYKNGNLVWERKLPKR